MSAKQSGTSWYQTQEWHLVTINHHDWDSAAAQNNNVGLSKLCFLSFEERAGARFDSDDREGSVSTTPDIFVFHFIVKLNYH